ncbi:hypothetical protein [Paraburkholderia eburnea]|nr:hypothetical protein [Paraburkholderia eburnea]
MLRDHPKHGGVDAVMVTIAKENPGVFRDEQLAEIRARQRVTEANDALAAVA